MTTASERPSPGAVRARGLFRTSAGIAVAMAVMNVATYGFQMVAARLMGPVTYGAVAGLTALLMVIAVLQLGLQATAARRIADDPARVQQIERVVLRVSYGAAVALGLVVLVTAPVVHRVLRLDSVTPAVLLAVAAVPLTVMGGQAGILQGERRWLELSLVYLGVGVPRLVLGTICILVSPTETSAMVGVMLGMWVPVVVGWWSLRRGREPGTASQAHTGRTVLAETGVASLALLAFFALSNADIVVARGVLDAHDAGLYAGGLILTKAVLFLPQFVVVVAFPSLSTTAERSRALVIGLAVTVAVGVVSTLGAWALQDLALVFVGGDEYAEVRSRLWLFAVLGTLLATLQLAVYAVLAQRRSRTTVVVALGVVVLVAAATTVESISALLAAVSVVDGIVAVLLLGYLAWSLTGRRGVPSGDGGAGSVGGLVPAAPGADRDVEGDGELGGPAHP